MNRLGVAVVAAWLASCGDPPICPSDVFVAIQTSQVTSDSDSAAAGVQSDIRVRTSLEEGELVTLEVFTASDQSLGSVVAPVDGEGLAVFHDVTVSNPATHLRASVSVFCGDAEDQLDIPVTAGSACDLVFSPTPEDNGFYAPARVLNSLSDPDPLAPGFQAKLIVDTTPGTSVEIFENNGNGDVSLGSFPAGDTGIVQIDRTLPDGQRSYRAICAAPSGPSSISAAVNLVIDVTPPSCAFSNPAAGTTITPTFDTNLDLSDGVQLFVAAQVDGNDVSGEPTSLSVSELGGQASAIAATNIDVDGKAGGAVSLAPLATPATFNFVFGARDHAHNTCTLSQNFDVVYDGCDLVVTSPTLPVTVDADGVAAGSQVDIAVQVSTACIGQTVTSNCGANSPSGVVDGNGQVTLRSSWCGTSPCELTSSCTLQVATPSGVVTSTSTSITFDDQGPATSIAIVSPAIACNSTITPAADIDPATDGVQVVARVTTTGATTQALEQVASSGTTTVDATSDVTVTVEPGLNKLAGIAADALGNTTRTAACKVTLDDLNVSFAAPAADGLLSRSDGTVAGNTITFPLCGSVNKVGSSVALVIDNAAPLAATVTGTTWCRTVTLAESPPSHTIVATATAGTSAGSASLLLAIDLTAPPPVDSFFVSVTNRHTIALTWAAPSEPVVAYVAKISTTPITEANFDTTGVVLATSNPQPPGSPETLDFTTARVGTSYFAAIVTVDAAGNRSLASISGPLTPALERSGGIVAPDRSLGALRFGTAIAHGHFNDDEFDDLAISAPTQNAGALVSAGAVYVYFGSASGISTTPDAIISATVADARFGAGLTAIHRPGTVSNRDDLVVGAPGLATHGAILLFRGGSTFTAGARDAGSAELVISPDPAAPGALATSSFGAWLVTADVDGDSQPDLVTSIPTSNANTGGAVVLYGDTITATSHLSDVDSSGANGVIADSLTDSTIPNRQLGTYLHAVGPTAGLLDLTDDLVLVYADDSTTSDSLLIYRGDGTRPSTPGVTLRPFAIGRDVRLDYVTASATTEFGAQVTSIDDRDNDGARDLVVSAHRNNNDRGQVLVISGDILGAGGIAKTTDSGVTLTTISGASAQRLGAIILANDGVSDFDNDGRDDLLIVARVGTGNVGFVWFGGTLPSGSTSTLSAPFSFAAPSTFKIGLFNRTGALGIARFVGDLDNDGVPDVCWATRVDSTDDGSFEVFQ